MIASEIIAGCERDGISLSSTNDGMVRYSGPEYALKYWLPIVAENKAAILGALEEDQRNDDQETAQRCQDCIHFSAPGLSDGYCGQRDDLPPAYGINHPLKRLPSDNGATCSEWELSEFCQFEQHNPKEQKQ